MKRWISTDYKPNILLFNRYIPQHIYLSKLDANIFVLETKQNNNSNIFCADNDGMYKLIRNTIPIEIDFVIVFNNEDIPIANNIKASLGNNPILVGCHDKELLGNFDINVCSDKTLEELAMKNNYFNIVYINKCVDRDYFTNTSKYRRKETLTFSTKFKNENNISEWSENTVIPQTSEHRRTLYNESRCYLDDSELMTYEMLEAMSCGCPTISKVKNSIICHGVNGYIYSNKEEIHKINNLLSNSGLLTHISEYSSQAITGEQYSVKNFVDNWNQLLRQIKETL